jgi:hypothetical protein
LKYDVKVPSKSNMQENLFFVNIVKVNDKKEGSKSASGSGSISQRHGSADPDPDPHEMSWIRNTAFKNDLAAHK